MSTQGHTPQSGPTFGDALTVLVLAKGIEDASAVRLIAPGRADYNITPEDKNLIVRAVNSHADMLAALKECEGFCKGHQESPEKVARYQRVRAAIAKAEGRS